MVVEGVAAVRSDHVGRRLGDVVEQRGGARDQVGRRGVDGRDGVVVDVVGVVAALLDPDRREQLGQHELEQPAVAEHGDPGTRVRGDQQAADLVADPLDGEDRGSRGLRPHRLDRPRSEREAEPGDESRGAVHAQRVLGERLGRVERRAQHAGDAGRRAPWPVMSMTSPSKLWQSALTVKSRRHTSSTSVPGPHVGLARLRVVALGPGAHPLDDPGPAADLRGAEALESLRRVPAEAGCDRGEQRHRVHARR